jgi:hypothetical protein
LVRTVDDAGEAAAQIWNLQSFRSSENPRVGLRAADCKSAIQQIENLRYAFGPGTAIRSFVLTKNIA